VAIILAIAVGVSLLVFEGYVLYEAISSVRGLSENSTQVLIAAFSGLIGALAVYLGGRVIGGK